MWFMVRTQTPMGVAGAEPLHRIVRPETIEWGQAIRFTYKPSRSFEVVCRYHPPQPRCRKSCSWTAASGAAGRADAIKRLKYWCLRAPDAQSRAQHCAGRGCPQLSPEQERQSDDWLDAELAPGCVWVWSWHQKEQQEIGSCFSVGQVVFCKHEKHLAEEWNESACKSVCSCADLSDTIQPVGFVLVRC